MSSLKSYLDDVSLAIFYKDGGKIASMISISSPELTTRSQFPVPTQYDLQGINNEKLMIVLQTYLKIAKVIVHEQDIVQVFELELELLQCLNRCAEKEDVWIIPPLINTTKELRKLYNAKLSILSKQDLQKQHDNNYDNNNNNNNNDKPSDLEKMANMISKSFQICLNDRNLDQNKSKRIAVFFFIGELFKIYSNLQKYDMARSIEKTLTSLRDGLPTMESINKSHAVTYLYFSGSIACSQGNFEEARSRLLRAFAFCGKSFKSQQESILLLLIPINFFTNKKFPNDKLWENYPISKSVYYKIFKSIKKGDLKSFDNEFKKIEAILLKKQVYIVMMKLRLFVILSLLKRIWKILGQNPHLPISAVQLALEYSSSHKPVNEGNFSITLDAAESTLSTLIASGKIKGYISHGNRVAVLSKNEPFPN
ncbi:hypothetical protein PACTADRAFT_34833 [Pachysolen tannophilus NRRL Y-2460]|uniref:PCI domain-containing protein n=1 Tax=Pachysolen tannophilus NRRL Y-2460 TaxID=669874 RepID=A0A1E4TTM7_PACTA|nr:hypothetical protein PACTADRAFT_34833 [Pachysolen tannophilus NRRL Y-2460]